MNVGHVYVVHTTLARPPKDKLAVCICASEFLFFWINTKARSDGIGQLQLEAGDHAALNHKCYLDCSRVTTFPPVELRAAHHRGPISAALAERIIQSLTDFPPKTLAPRYGTRRGPTRRLGHPNGSEHLRRTQLQVAQGRSMMVQVQCAAEEGR